MLSIILFVILCILWYQYFEWNLKWNTISVYHFAGMCDQLKDPIQNAVCIDGTYVRNNKSYLLAPEKAYVAEFYDKKFKFGLQYEYAKATI